MMVDDETHLSRTKARGGSSNHTTRYVLPISLALVIAVFMLILYLWR
jgi:hypothetical protein